MLLAFLLLILSFGFLFMPRSKLKTAHAKSSYDLKKIKRYSRVRFGNKYLTNQSFDTIVIGSGIGGLTCAGLLAKSGHKVLVLEQHYIAGGTMHTFDLKGVQHETGIHYIGNINKRAKILDLITSIPITWSKLGWETENEIYDEIIIGNKHYKFPSGRNNIINYLIDLFPHQKEGIIKYFDDIEHAAAQDLFFF